MRNPFTLAMAAASLAVGLVSPTSGQAAFSKGGRLVTVVPGIRDEASDGWVATAAALAPTRVRWVVREEGVGTYAHLSDVPPDHIITIRTNASPESVRQAVHAIAQQKDVTVIVDMKLGWNVTESGWAPHTKWAAVVSEALSESHAERFPDARSLYVGHSAGTEPVAIMDPTMRDTRRQKGAEAQDRPLYDDIMVLSPRRSPDDPGYPKHAVLAFADGDFYSNPKGHIGADSIFTAYGEKDAVAFANKGYSVVRMLDNASVLWDVPLAHRKTEHTIITDVTAPDRQMVYYSPSSAVPITMPTTALGNVLKVAVDVQDGRTGSIQEAVHHLQANEPTKGIGGISLNASAYVPIDPKDVHHAAYDSTRQAVCLRLKGGKAVWFPRMDPEVLRQSYDIAYVAGTKAELSIGSNRATDPGGKQVVNLQAAGKDSVYYFGQSQDTLLGLVMFKADATQGELAFTVSPAVREVARHVAGFHSLAELFPEKYASHPAESEYIGSGERVFLTPRTVMVTRSTDGGSLEFGEFAVSIRFGQMGPAESAYATFFEMHLHEILKTQSGAAIADLIPYIRGAAIFRWMRENNIRFVPGALESVQVSQVFTPNSTDIFWGPKLEDVSVQPPTIFFGLSGPTRLVRGNGSESTITYEDGKVSEVHRYDGQTLRVYRDGLGVPLAIHWAGAHAAAFISHKKVGLTLVNNVNLKLGSYGPSTTLRPSSTLYPIVNPESIVSSYVVRFANGDLTE